MSRIQPERTERDEPAPPLRMPHGLSVVALLTKVTGLGPGTGLNVIVSLPVTVTLPALALTTAVPGVGSSVTVIVDRSP